MTQHHATTQTPGREGNRPPLGDRVHVSTGNAKAVMKGLLLLMATIAVGCGGSSPSAPTPVAVPTPAPPAAAITANGNGSLVLHPSINPTFAVALEAPIQVRETAGGTADFNFARMAFFQKGKEIERAEVGADGIRNAGAGRITPNSNATYKVIFRFNADDFDDIVLTLGFTDIKDGRQFTVTVPGRTFTDVDVSFTPLFRGRIRR